MAQQTVPQNSYSIVLPPLANKTVQLTFEPTYLRLVVYHSTDTMLLDADSEYTSVVSYVYYYPHLGLS
jgi:hypothetical protein